MPTSRKSDVAARTRGPRARPAAPGARIHTIEAIPLRLPFARAFTMAAPHQATRGEVEIVVLRVLSDEGLVGLGETQAWRRQGSGETLSSLHGKLRDVAASALVGRSAFDIGSILADCAARTAGNPYVLAAVGDALYDLAARSMGRPVHDLLGGACRDRIPVGLALGIAGEPGAVVDAAEAAVDKGYRHLRLKIGLDPAHDLATAQAMRKRFGVDVVLRADANGGMAYDEALRLLRKLEPLDFDIVEQPLPHWDLAGMAALARAVRIPLSADESLTDDHSLVAIARTEAARVVQTKSAKNGGIHAIRRLWQLAESFGIGIFPGNHPSTGINVAAVAHTAAAWSGRLLVGDFQTGAADMIAEDIVAEPVRVERGQVIVPAGPGLGVELDPDKVRRFRLDT